MTTGQRRADAPGPADELDRSRRHGEAGGGSAAARAGRRRAGRQWPLPKQADPDAPLLEVEHLTTHFTLPIGDVHAVDGVSFRLDHGEALGIAGESGCGKTTTALSLVRLLPANATIVERQRQALWASTSSAKSENALRRYRWREIASSSRAR